MAEKTFEPFMDRLSRDIRNNLSESYLLVLQEQSLKPAQQVAQTYAPLAPEHCYQHYIKTRLEKYSTTLQTITGGCSDPLWQGFVLWDAGLFFEVHEILEHAWLRQKGDEKLLLQAMIRAAGVYIKLEHGYTNAASKLASKALPVLKDHQKRLEEYITPSLLYNAMEQPKWPAPILLKTK